MPWLYRIAANEAKAHWRKHRRDCVISLEEHDIAEKKTISKGFEDAELFELLKNAVWRLPPKLRETIILHYMQYLTISEAAKAVGIREGTFKSRLNRALKQLRKTIEEKNEDGKKENRKSAEQAG